MTANERKRIYSEIVRVLERGAFKRTKLFESVAVRLGLSEAEIKDTCTGGKSCKIRAAFGEVLEAMLGRGLIKENDGLFTLTESKPVTVKALECEREILTMLAIRSMTKHEIRAKLEEIFGTGKTATERDDHVLFSHLGQILKRLVSERTLVLTGDTYAISEKKVAIIGDINSMLELKTEFLDKLHSKGGEFFEHYFLKLLSLYLTKKGKTVTESYVTGGASDGGIDGVIKTVDCLGFRETIMVQTKNRITHVPETEVRGFYGAVCAKMGSRGIFVTSSDFHSSAAKFLASIDNCVGVNGTRIFEMAAECSFGIKKSNGKYVIDNKII